MGNNKYTQGDEGHDAQEMWIMNELIPSNVTIMHLD